MINSPPNGWVQYPLGDLCEIVVGKTPSTKNLHYWDGKNLWANIGDLNDGILNDTEEKITDQAVEECGIKLIKAGTLLFSFKLTIGKLAFTGADMYTNEAIAALTNIDASKIAPKFLFYALKKVTFIHEIREASKGNTLNKKALHNLLVFFPKSLTEQRRLVSILDNSYAKINLLKEYYADFEKDLNNSLLSIYGKIIKDADYKQMSEVAPLIRRKIAVKKNQLYEEIGIRSFGGGTFNKSATSGEELGSKKIYRIEKGDLLFNIVFAWEGAIAIAKSEDNSKVGSHRFLTCVPKSGIATSPFLLFHFLTEQGLFDLGDASPGGTGRNRTLGVKKLANLKVPVPSYDKQIWFSSLWERINSVRRIKKEIEEELETFIPAFLDKIFQGEL